MKCRHPCGFFGSHKCWIYCAVNENCVSNCSKPKIWFEFIKWYFRQKCTFNPTVKPSNILSTMPETFKNTGRTTNEVESMRKFVFCELNLQFGFQSRKPKACDFVWCERTIFLFFYSFYFFSYWLWLGSQKFCEQFHFTELIQFFFSAESV